MTDDQLFGETDFEEENQKLRRENECLLSKNKRLTAFLVEQGLAEEYIRWKGDDCMSEKRFEVVLNEFDEVEYIMDKKLCEDKNFAEFMDFVEELAKENEQLKQKIERWKKGIVC